MTNIDIENELSLFAEIESEQGDFDFTNDEIEETTGGVVEEGLGEIETKYARFKSAPWFSNEMTTVLVGGAGGIGSWTSMLLARAGFYPTVYDNDILEEVNLAGQLYSKLQIGKSKAEALRQVCKDFADTTILCINDRLDETTPTETYVISAFDNMLARKQMFEKWREVNSAYNNLNAIFIDGRLEAEIMWIFCVKPGNGSIQKYRETLKDDSEMEELPCTMKQTSHAAAMIASHIVGFFTNHIANVLQDDDRRIPYKWEYFIPMSKLTEEYL